jgi:ribose transport system substrate-binding protein
MSHTTRRESLKMAAATALSACCGKPMLSSTRVRYRHPNILGVLAPWRSPFSFLLPLCFFAAALGCRRDAAGGAGDGAGARIRIAVIPKGTTHEFWKSVHGGAVKAARELDVDIVWKGALREDDLKGQIDVVQSFVAQAVSGIAVAPLSDKGLVGSVKAAAAAHVPVVVFDSDLASDDYVSFVATDNEAAGKMAAQALAARITGAVDSPGKRAGNVVILRYQEGSASTIRREKGFVDFVRARPDLKLVSDSQYGGATTESAEKASENLLAAQKVDSGSVQGIFAPNESTTFGMLLALRKAGLAGKVHFVGFDASDKLVQAVRTGEIDALVVQRPFEMGYLAVKTMVARLRGQPVDRRIDTGSMLVTRDNLDAPEIKALVSPDLKTWLGE